MKSILIIGASHAGKSTTMSEVCKRLIPSKVYKLVADKSNLENSQIEISEVDKIFNDTFIVEVQGKLILVVAGAPTEQGIRITILIEICIKINIEISFLVVSMRSFEKKDGFNTFRELSEKSELILTEKIHRIDAEKFKEDVTWNQRIDRIVESIKANI